MANVRFVYLYRDGSNYKDWGEVVFRYAGDKGLEDLQQDLSRSFDSGQLFIANQVRVPELFPWRSGLPDADDHCFHEFDVLEYTDECPTDAFGRTIEEFACEVAAASRSGWRCFDPAEVTSVTSRKCS